MDTPPPPAAPGGGEDKAKRARRRSRYLTDDYETPTLLNDLHGRHPPPPPRKGVVPVNEGAALLLQLHLQEADLLAALHRSATCPYDLPGPGGLGFFALHRAWAWASVSVPSTHRGKDTTVISSSSSKDDAAAPRLNPCLVHGSAGNGKEQADAVAMEHSAYAHHTAGPANAAAAALGVAGGATGPSKRRNKKKIPLTDVRKNLEKMIASLTGQTMLDKDSAWSLAGEMRHLLFKVDRALGAAGAGPSTSAAAHHH